MPVVGFHFRIWYHALLEFPFLFHIFSHFKSVYQECSSNNWQNLNNLHWRWLMLYISRGFTVVRIRYESSWLIPCTITTDHLVQQGGWGWIICHASITAHGRCLCDQISQQYYSDVIMGMMASQITSLIIVYSHVYSGTDQRKHQSSASLAFVRGIHRGPVPGEFPAQMASNAGNVSIWWRHHECVSQWADYTAKHKMVHVGIGLWHYGCKYAFIMKSKSTLWDAFSVLHKSKNIQLSIGNECWCPCTDSISNFECEL